MPGRRHRTPRPQLLPRSSGSLCSEVGVQTGSLRKSAPGSPPPTSVTEKLASGSLCSEVSVWKPAPGSRGQDVGIQTPVSGSRPPEVSVRKPAPGSRGSESVLVSLAGARVGLRSQPASEARAREPRVLCSTFPPGSPWRRWEPCIPVRVQVQPGRSPTYTRVPRAAVGPGSGRRKCAGLLQAARRGKEAGRVSPLVGIRRTGGTTRTETEPRFPARWGTASPAATLELKVHRRKAGESSNTGNACLGCSIRT